MKKYLIYTLLALTLFTSCKKSNDVPAGEKPEARVAATLATYSALLTNNTTGWKATLFAHGGITYLFSMKFSTSNRVTMLSDLSTAYSTTSLESSYRLRQQQGPSLLFDTYTYIHVVADPDPTVNGGKAGSGSNSDFEFTFDSVVGDTIKLVGNKLGSKLTLVKASSAADYNAYTTGTQDILSKFSQLKTYFKRTTIGTTECEVRIDAINKTMAFSYLVNGALVTVSTGFYIDGSSNTMNFVTPVTIAGTKVTSVKGLTFDATNVVFGGTVNGAPFQLKQAIAPLLIDLNAAQRWYDQIMKNPNTCWVSDNAFHNNGIDDYCGFRKVPSYTSFWYAGSTVFSGAGEGIITFTTGLAAPYAFTKTPFTVTNGIGRFTLLSSSSGFTGTTPIALAMTSARAIMYGGATVNSFADWYFIPTATDGVHYDMVRASDALAWISWRQR